MFNGELDLITVAATRTCLSSSIARSYIFVLRRPLPIVSIYVTYLRMEWRQEEGCAIRVLLGTGVTYPPLTNRSLGADKSVAQFWKKPA